MSRDRSGAAATVGTLTMAARLLDVPAEEGHATVARLATLTGEPRSSLYRLLGAMEGLGLVDSGPRRGEFQLGAHLLRLGSAVLARYDERRAALPAMERLHAETGQTVFLMVPRERRAVCIERIDGREVRWLALELGGSLPLHAGAGPRVMLAHMPRSAWDAYVADGELERLTRATPTTAETLFPLLEESLETGYAVSDDDVTIGIGSLGVPVFDYRGTLRRALSIGGTRGSVLEEGRDRLLEQLQAAGREVSRQLGAELSDVAGGFRE